MKTLLQASKLPFLPIWQLIFKKFILRTIWVAVIATFGIQLLFTFLPPRQISDSRTNFSENHIYKKWDTASYVDWGKSLFSSRPQISDTIINKWLLRDFFLRTKTTFLLCSIAFLCSALMGIFIGVIKSQIYNKTISGRIEALPRYATQGLNYLIFFLSSIPAYMIAFSLFLLFNSESNLTLSILSLALGSGLTMDIARLSHNTHGAHLNSKYVENALICGLKTKGLLPLPGTVGWHAFRNSLITILPIVAYRFPLIVSSALVVEVVFDLPGLGENLLISLVRQDIPMILTIVLASVVFVQICVFIAECLVFVLQPQKRSN